MTEETGDRGELCSGNVSHQLVSDSQPVNMEELDPATEPVKVSVSQEIRRFQEEINKVQAENVKFYQWKQRRSKVPVPSPRKGLTSAISSDSLLSNNKKKGQKRVSYCDAVTVFGSSESLGWLKIAPNINVAMFYCFSSVC